jgi:hypothetical protein
MNLNQTSIHMNDVKILFGDIVVEEHGKDGFLVRKGSTLISPFEYAYFWWLSSKCCVFRRNGKQKVDILFSNGRWFFGAIYAHELARFGPDNSKSLIAAIGMYGTNVLSEEGDYLAFIPGYPRITVLYDSFLVAFQQEGVMPQVRVYDFYGHLLSEGTLWDAISEALNRT